MLTCPLGHEEAGRTPNCVGPSGEVWFEDPASLSEKAAAAALHGLGGIGYWTVGSEPPGFFDAIRQHL
jgi:spore germination protein YaaH